LISLFGLIFLLIQTKKRNKAEKALQENKNFLTSVFDSIQDGISILDRELNVVRVNKVMHQWYPDVSIFAGKKCYQVYHEKSSPCTACPTVRALASNKLEMNEIPLVMRGHEAGTLELYAFPILDSDGHATGVVEYIRNITTRKNAEKEKEKLIEKLQSALDEIKTLRGILPVCCYCKDIRDDKGYWDQIESYISKHSEATFSHGICPNCMKEHYPELYKSEPYKKIQQDRNSLDVLK
jgi:PAS domain-containing protein